MIKGSCLCSKFTFEVSQIQGPIVHCHCSFCRKAHSAAFSTNATVNSADFTIINGEELLTSYESSPGKKRYFCRNCGTHLFHQKIATADQITLKIGSLDTWNDFENNTYESYHINCDSAEPGMAYKDIIEYQKLKI